MTFQSDLQMSMTSLKSIIPRVFLNKKKKKKEEGDKFTGSTCRNAADERRIVMLAQRFIHCASQARTKMPKKHASLHVCIGMVICHITGSKQLVTMPSQMGHCLSFDSARDNRR